MKVVIVGGVAGGASTAARLRRMDENAEIILFERGPYISFANCGLPYHIGGVIDDREKLLLMTPEGFKDWFEVESRVNSEVIAIDREKKQVLVRETITGREYSESYDRLVLSPGAQPFVPPIPGVDLEGVFSLRSIPDMDAIKEHLNAKRPQRAVVVGGGFIGIELAENLSHLGLQITMVEMARQVMAPLDYEMAAMVHHHLAFKKVRLALSDGLKEIQRNPDGSLNVIMNSGRHVDADLVLLSIGIRPEYHLAQEAGLDVSKRAIIASDTLQTNDPDIYALGDAVEVASLITGNKVNVPLAGPASKQARIVADHIAGRNVRYGGVLGTSVVKVYDLTIASTGLNHQQLKDAGIAHNSVIIHAANHAGYYPGASPIAIKLLFADDGRIFGAQAVGIEGVDKRIDVFATAIMGGMTVFDLEEVELAYAPPYGASRDPVNIAAFSAANVLRGDAKMVYWDQIDRLDRSDVFIVDVREPVELEAGMIDGAHNIPLGRIRERMREFPRDRQIVVYCAAGKRGYFAERILKQHGFNVVNLSGGYKTYQHAVGRQSNFDIFEHVVVDKRDDITEVPPKALVEGAEIVVDAKGLQCPGPILALGKAMQGAKPGDVVKISVTDFGFVSDVEAWSRRTGNNFMTLDDDNGVLTARVQKGLGQAKSAASGVPATTNKSMVVFSGDLDKALAAFIIANGAAAMGQKVTMFFTFWGLNILRRDDPPAVDKNLKEKMFGAMMPRGPEELTLSRMNMGGLGTGMIKNVMKEHNITPLPEMIRIARENGVRLMACQMSMDLMGIRREELIDGLEMVGVATFIDAMDDSNGTLFI